MKNIKVLKIAALIVSGLTLGVLLLFALGETIGGDWSGLGHLIQAIPIGLLLWLGCKRPLWGGILLLILSLAAFPLFGVSLRGSEWLAPFLIIIAPLFLSGVLFLGAAGLEKKAG
jgi:hypothetical protein